LLFAGLAIDSGNCPMIFLYKIFSFALHRFMSNCSIFGKVNWFDLIRS
jgi:hypothetical protein